MIEEFVEKEKDGWGTFDEGVDSPAILESNKSLDDIPMTIVPIPEETTQLEAGTTTMEDKVKPDKPQSDNCEPEDELLLSPGPEAGTEA